MQKQKEEKAIFKQISSLKDFCKSRYCNTVEKIILRVDNKLLDMLVARANHIEKPTIIIIKTTLLALRNHALGLNLRWIAMQKTLWPGRNGMARGIFPN